MGLSPLVLAQSGMLGVYYVSHNTNVRLDQSTHVRYHVAHDTEFWHQLPNGRRFEVNETSTLAFAVTAPTADRLALPDRVIDVRKGGRTR